MHDANTIRAWIEGLPTPSEESMGDNYSDRSKWSRLRAKQVERVAKDGVRPRGGSKNTPQAQGRVSPLTQAQINYIRNL